MLVISNRPRASRSSDFEITHVISLFIVLHSVQLLLLIIIIIIIMMMMMIIIIICIIIIAIIIIVSLLLPYLPVYGRRSGLMVSALVPGASGPGSSPGRGHCGQDTLGQDTQLSLNSTLTVPLSTQEYKWVPANCRGNLTNCGEVTCDGLASHPGGVEILLAAFMIQIIIIIIVFQCKQTCNKWQNSLQRMFT